MKGKIFAKKHAEEFEDFHKTANYLQKAVKKYNLPGNANRTLELQSLLIKLRDEYNALVPEHNAFLLKKETASKYTRKVRSYLADEHIAILSIHSPPYYCVDRILPIPYWMI